MVNLEKIKDNLSVSATSLQRFQLCYDEKKALKGARTFARETTFSVVEVD